MKIKRLSPDFTAASQLEVEKLPKVVAAGYRAILCNRPDGEGIDQPDFAVIARAAQARGLAAAYLPVDGGDPGPVLDRFRAALADLPKPVLAYSRTGGRSARLWLSAP